MKDFLGNKVNPGDIVIETRGWKSAGPYNNSIKIYEIPIISNGSGLTYDLDGGKHEFYWAHLEKSVKINICDMPEGFEYSFKHGMGDVYCKIKTGTAPELINNSDWEERKITKTDVDKFNILGDLKLYSMDDITENIDCFMGSKYIPREVVSKVLNISKYGEVRVINGEIGIASIHNNYRFCEVIRSIHKALNKENNLDL